MNEQSTFKTICKQNNNMELVKNISWTKLNNISLNTIKVPTNQNNNNYILEETFNDLKSYWYPFGFFSKSTFNSFQQDVYKNLSITKQEHNENDVFENNNYNNKIIDTIDWEDVYLY